MTFKSKADAQAVADSIAKYLPHLAPKPAQQQPKAKPYTAESLRDLVENEKKRREEEVFNVFAEVLNKKRGAK